MKLLLFLFCFVAFNFAHSQDVKNAKTESTSEQNTNYVYSEVDTEPSFPGGMEAMMKFIQKKFRYPRVAIENNIEGKCFIRFVVNSKGKVTNVVVQKGVVGCPECDAEAVRVIRSMPKWKPGKVKNKKVSTYFTIPINFKLE